MKILVTGGHGFIGTHLSRRLEAEGHDVVRADRTNGFDLTNPAHANLVVPHAEWVFHLAADMGGVAVFHGPDDLGAALTNQVITANVLRACAELGVARTFVASSACCYPIELQQRIGNPVKLPEEYVGMGTPDALYGAEKLQALRLASKVPGARVGILHTVYGPGQDWEGRRAKFPASVCRKAIEARRTGELELWGDGKQMRSYLHVDDAVERIMRVMTADHYDGPVNIGSEGAISCLDAAYVALEIAGAATARVTTNPAEPSGVQARDCSNAKFDRLYGKGPDMGLRAGFTSLIGWLDEVMT